ncbi:hypothetical protein BC829DRAFT_423984 [Chytridium lagenaria]|nr:hypothetical protein BC829DRAFT_423984 [Chytridium lagenaria]
MPKGTLKSQRFVVVREALRTIGITSGVIDMSFVGSSVIHLLVDSAATDTITTCLRRHGFLLTDFDPLVVPPHSIAPSLSAPSTDQVDGCRTNCIRRLAILLSRSGAVKADAITRPFSPDIANAAIALAASFRRASATAPPPTLPRDDPLDAMASYCFFLFAFLFYF